MKIEEMIEEEVVEVVEDSDAIFRKIGEFGVYQAVIFVIVSFIAVVPAMTAYSYVYNGATPEFRYFILYIYICFNRINLLTHFHITNERCKLPDYENDTFEIQSENHQYLVDYHIPSSKTDAAINRYDGCHLKEYLDDSFLDIKNATYNLVECSQWVYSKEYYSFTVVTKVDRFSKISFN